MSGNTAPLTRWIITINVGVAILTNFTLFSSGDYWASEVLGFTIGGFLEGAIWQPFTSMWVHAPFIGAGVMHILFNMLTLHFVGRAVEIHLGAQRLAWIYFPGGLIAVAVFALDMILRSWLGDKPGVSSPWWGRVEPFARSSGFSPPSSRIPGSMSCFTHTTQGQNRALWIYRHQPLDDCL
jgi:membrane associated rhomboid family serine protease